MSSRPDDPVPHSSRKQIADAPAGGRVHGGYRKAPLRTLSKHHRARPAPPSITTAIREAVMSAVAAPSTGPAPTPGGHARPYHCRHPLPRAMSRRAGRGGRGCLTGTGAWPTSASRGHGAAASRWPGAVEPHRLHSSFKHLLIWCTLEPHGNED